MPPVDRNNPKRAKSSDSQYSLMEFMREFPDDATCLEWLWRNRYSKDGKHAHCPKCDDKTIFERYETSQQRQSWTCTSCGHHLHPTAGTIFHKSSTSLYLWFYAMYLMTSTRCGISAKQLERELGVTYKTAWRMAFLIRNELMTQGAGPFTSGNPVVNGRNVHWWKRAGHWSWPSFYASLQETASVRHGSTWRQSGCRHRPQRRSRDRHAVHH